MAFGNQFAQLLTDMDGVVAYDPRNCVVIGDQLRIEFKKRPNTSSWAHCPLAGLPGHTDHDRDNRHPAIHVRAASWPSETYARLCCLREEVPKGGELACLHCSRLSLSLSLSFAIFDCVCMWLAAGCVFVTNWHSPSFLSGLLCSSAKRTFTDLLKTDGVWHKVTDIRDAVAPSWKDVPTSIHPMQLPSLFRNILYFTGRFYVIVWTESEVEVVETSAMVGRLASYNLLQGDKPPRRLMLNELSPHVNKRQISYDPSRVRVDDRHIYMWPIYPEPRPLPNDVERLNHLVNLWFKSDRQ